MPSIGVPRAEKGVPAHSHVVCICAVVLGTEMLLTQNVVQVGLCAFALSPSAMLSPESSDGLDRVLWNRTKRIDPYYKGIC